jgi:hypothetical protein
MYYRSFCEWSQKVKLAYVLKLGKYGQANTQNYSNLEHKSGNFYLSKQVLSSKYRDLENKAWKVWTSNDYQLQAIIVHNLKFIWPTGVWYATIFIELLLLSLNIIVGLW